MRKITALTAAAALAVTLTACSGTAEDDGGITVAPTGTVEYHVIGEVIVRLSDGTTVPHGFTPIGTITYVDMLGVTRRSTDVVFPYTSAKHYIKDGETASITAYTLLDGWIECSIEIDGRVVTKQRSEESDEPSASCSATV